MNGDRITRRGALRATAGAATAVAGAGVAGGAAAQAPDYGGWFDDVDNYDGSTADATGQSQVTVEVGANGNGGTFAFEPPAVRIDPGTTVTFSWTSNTHNVLVEEQPSGAGWEGHAPIEDTGFEFEHTFETEGVYTYYCEPHLSLGMKGAIVVGGEAVGGGEGGGAAGLVPLFTVGGGVLGVAFLSLVGVGTYVLLHPDRYAPATGADATRTVPAVTEEATPATSERTLDHDEFDPVGTLSLILVYFGILALLWVFMYFVEFLGRGGIITG
jgi:halocyanin-like protein